MNPFRHKTTKPMAMLNSCSRIYPIFAADALLEIGTAVISAFMSLDEYILMISAANALVYPQRCGVCHLSILSDNGHVSCRKNFVCPKILLPVGVLTSYSVLLCQDTHW
jgi:hypothetical protein